MRWIIGLWCLLSFSLLATPYEQSLELLASGKSSQRDQAIELLLASDNPDARHVLQQLQQGSLYREKASNQLMVLQGKSGSKLILSPLFEDNPQEFNKRKVKRVGLNNSLRQHIRSGLARKDLSHTDDATREQAVQQLLGSLTSETRDLLIERQGQETDSDVQQTIAAALAIDTLQNADNYETAQLSQAIDTLTGELEPLARSALVRFADGTEQEQLQAKATQAIADIDQKIRWSSHIETLFFGLSLGSVLVLAAIGLSITFGVMGVINMAHGELIMLGAYTTFVIQQLMPNQLGWSIAIAIPAAFVVSGLVGIAIERGVIRFLYGRPLETLLATFGISLILQQTVRTIFSPLNQTVATPEWMSGSLVLNPVLSLTLNRLYIIGFCLMVFALLFYLLRYTRLGLQVRAVSQNRSMARAMGVRSERVDALTFGLGSGIAGVAGVALSQLTNVGPNLGQSYIIDSFMVVVFGGVGNLWGTLVAGMSLGIANKLMEPMAGAVLAKILVLVFIILFIQKRPRGLFPQKGRSAEG